MICTGLRGFRVVTALNLISDFVAIKYRISNPFPGSFRPAFYALTAGILSIFLLGCKSDPVIPPYHASQFISGIDLDWSTYLKMAPGSDNWPITWARNNHQYTTWGDGGGFGGTNDVGRVSLGVAKIQGTYDDFIPTNIWGGENSDNLATFKGKSYGILALGNDLYMWVSPGSNIRGYEHSRLYRSFPKSSDASILAAN